MRTIRVETITRVEGHGKITVQLDENGTVQDAHLHVLQFRGFEKFSVGRPFYEMPSLTSRICGICPVSHLLAGAKACDAIMGLRIPESAEMLRRVVHLAQVAQSHALSFFHLSAPDFLMGWDADPAERNVLGMAEEHPDQVVGVETILSEALSYPPRMGNPQVIHTHIKNIRTKFRTAEIDPQFLTSSRQGYMLVTSA